MRALVDPVLSHGEMSHRRKGRTPFQTVRADFRHTAYRWSSGRGVHEPTTEETPRSDSRCARLAFAIGLYEAPCPDPGGADGPLVFRPAPCTRAAPPTPPRPRARTSPDWGARDVAFAAT